MKYFIILFLSILSFTACKDSSQNPSQKVDKKITDSALKDYNKNIALEELEQIDFLLERYKWPVIETGTGIRYWVYQKGEGRQIKIGDKIKCDYTLSLINGKIVYNSENDGFMKFEVGNSNVVPGLAEGIQLFHEGDGVKLIIPSNLGYGIAGDGDKIPSRTTIIYDLKNIKIVN